MMMVTARDVHAAVLVIPMPPAIEVRAARVAMHVAPVAVTARRNVHPAVLVVPMPIAIKMPAMWVAVHVATMVTIPVISIDVDILHLVHNPIRRGAHRPQRRRLRGY